MTGEESRAGAQGWLTTWKQITSATLQDQIQLHRQLQSQSYPALSPVSLSLILTNCIKSVLLFLPFYRWRNQGTERLVTSQSDMRLQSQNSKQRTFPEVADYTSDEGQGSVPEVRRSLDRLHQNGTPSPLHITLLNVCIPAAAQRH